IYIYCLFTLTIACNWVMRKAKERWPRIGTFGLVMVAFGTMAVFDFVIEGNIIMPLGFWSYGGAIPSLSLQSGRYFQFPIYEASYSTNQLGGAGFPDGSAGPCVPVLRGRSARLGSDRSLAVPNVTDLPQAAPLKKN